MTEFSGTLMSDQNAQGCRVDAAQELRKGPPWIHRSKPL